MFYAHFVLAKKGPLARIWLAAHWDKKLTKAHVFETNIDDSVKDIMSPKVKMALRTSGHLLLGVVRIYSRKAKYLLADCNEAFVKIKMAFRPGMVDLPEDNREAAMNAITLPEVFHDFDTAMPDIGEQTFQDQFKMNQTRAEEITMREDYGNIALDAGGADDGFGEQIGSPEMLRDPTDHEGGGDEYSGIQGSFSRAASTYGAPTHSLLLGQSHSMILGEQSVAGSIMGRGESLAPSRAGSIRPTSPGAQSLSGSIRPPSPCASIRSRADSIRPPSPKGSYVHPLRQDLDAPIQDDGFGGSMTGTGQDILAGGLFEDGSLFDDAPPSMPASAMSERGAPSVSDYNDGGPDQFGGPPSPGPSSGGSRGPSPIPPGSPTPSHRSEASHRSGASLAASTKSQASLAASQASTARSLRSTRSEAHSEAGEELGQQPEVETTTLIHNEEESFALAPVEASALKGLTRTKRKRKLIVDDVKAISGEEMKGQLSDTGDIVTTLDLAPPTKRLMHWKETGGVEKLFALPGRMLQSRHIHDDYSCNLIVRPSTLETFGELLGASQDEPDLDLEKVPGASEFQEPLPPVSKRGRKRKNVEQEAPVESAYSKKQTELAAAVEEDARLERERQVAAREEREDRIGEDSEEREAAREREERERERHTSGPALDLSGLDPGTPLARDRAEVDINTPAQEMNTPCQPGQTPLQTPVQGDFFSQQQTPQGSLGGRDQTFPDQTPGHDSYYGGGGATPAYSDYNGGGQTPAYNGVEGHPGGPQYPPTATPQYPSTETPQYPPTDTPQYPPTDTPQYPPTGTPQYPSTDTPQYPPHATPQYPAENTPHYHPPSSPPPPASPFPTPAHGLATPHLPHMEDDSPHDPAPGLPQGPQQDFTDQWVSQAATAQATGAALRPPCTPSHETDWDNNRPPSGASGRISPMEEDEEEEEEDDNDNEYLDEETVEQFEDRVLNKRAAQLHCRLRQRMVEEPVLAFSTITRRKDTKKVACQKFYSLLVLQKYCAVDLKQDEVGFGEMEVRRGPQFDLDTGKVKRKA